MTAGKNRRPIARSADDPSPCSASGRRIADRFGNAKREETAEVAGTERR
jgi:hypothetical protein